MEEMAVLWNHAAPDTLPRLEIQYDGANWRVYEGVIQELTLSRVAGHMEVPFRLVFAVVWSVTNPTLREWS